MVQNIVKSETLGIVTAGQVIGEDDFLSEKDVWTYSAKISHHQTSVYAIERTKFTGSWVLENLIEL
jgi:hypothetical protein